MNVAGLQHDNPFTRSFVEAGSKLYKENDDFNGEEQEGVGIYQVTQKMEEDAVQVAFLTEAKKEKTFQS